MFQQLTNGSRHYIIQIWQTALQKTVTSLTHYLRFGGACHPHHRHRFYPSVIRLLKSGSAENGYFSLACVGGSNPSRPVIGCSSAVRAAPLYRFRFFSAFYKFYNCDSLGFLNTYSVDKFIRMVYHSYRSNGIAADGSFAVWMGSIPICVPSAILSDCLFYNFDRKRQCGKQFLRIFYWQVITARGYRPVPRDDEGRPTKLTQLFPFGTYNRIQLFSLFSLFLRFLYHDKRALQSSVTSYSKRQVVGSSPTVRAIRA